MTAQAVPTDSPTITFIADQVKAIASAQKSDHWQWVWQAGATILGVIVGGAIASLSGFWLQRKKLTLDKELAEQKLVLDRELAEQKLVLDKDLADRVAEREAQEDAQKSREIWEGCLFRAYLTLLRNLSSIWLDSLALDNALKKSSKGSVDQVHIEILQTRATRFQEDPLKALVGVPGAIPRDYRQLVRSVSGCSAQLAEAEASFANWLVSPKITVALRCAFTESMHCAQMHAIAILQMLEHDFCSQYARQDEDLNRLMRLMAEAGFPVDEWQKGNWVKRPLYAEALVLSGEHIWQAANPDDCGIEET